MSEELKQGRNWVAELPQARSANFLEAYANNTGLAANFFDLTVLFGKIVVNADGKTAVVENTVSVTMAWEHAKALAAGLTRAIEAYEKEHAIVIRTSTIPDPQKAQ